VEAHRAELSVDIHSAHYTSCQGGGQAPTYQPSPPMPPAQWTTQGAPSPPAPGWRLPTPPAPARGQGGGRNSGGQGGGGGTRPVCQICSKVGHVASCCFK
jgi:hypothetical protein